MVFESEAVCSRCCTKHGYTINLVKQSEREFKCPHCSTRYKEDSSGYLVSVSL